MVRSVYLLVHAGWNAIHDPHPHLGVHPMEEQLSTQWEQIATGIRGKTDHALIYISPLKETELETGLTNEEGISHPRKRADVRRIKRWKAMLGDQLVVLSNDEYKAFAIADTLSEQHLAIDEEHTTLHPFGEYKERCVTNWGTMIRDMLLIRDENYQPLEDLSLPVGAIREIDTWRVGRSKEA